MIVIFGGHYYRLFFVFSHPDLTFPEVLADYSLLVAHAGEQGKYIIQMVIGIVLYEVKMIVLCSGPGVFLDRHKFFDPLRSLDMDGHRPGTKDIVIAFRSLNEIMPP